MLLYGIWVYFCGLLVIPWIKFWSSNKCDQHEAEEMRELLDETELSEITWNGCMKHNKVLISMFCCNFGGKLVVIWMFEVQQSFNEWIPFIHSTFSETTTTWLFVVIVMWHNDVGSEQEDMRFCVENFALFNLSEMFSLICARQWTWNVTDSDLKIANVTKMSSGKTLGSHSWEMALCKTVKMPSHFYWNLFHTTEERSMNKLFECNHCKAGVVASFSQEQFIDKTVLPTNSSHNNQSCYGHQDGGYCYFLIDLLKVLLFQTLSVAYELF